MICFFLNKAHSKKEAKQGVWLFSFGEPKGTKTKERKNSKNEKGGSGAREESMLRVWARKKEAG